MFLARDRRDGGAGSAEYAGLVVLAALILGVLVPIVAAPLRDNIAYELCKIFHPGDEGACTSPADKKYKPTTCTLSTSTKNYDASVDVEFVRVGKGLSFVRTTTVGNDGKKTVTLTAVDNTKLGVQAGIGAGWSKKGGQLGGNGEVSADVKIGIGDSWTFKDENGNSAESQADKFTSGITEHAVIKSAEHSGVVGWVGGHVYDAVAGPDIPKPDVSRYELSVNGSASASAGLGLGTKKQPSSTPPKGWRNKFNEKHDERSGRGFKPLSGGVSIDGSVKGIVEQYTDDHKDNRGGSAVTLQLTGGGSAYENHLVDGHKANANFTGAIKVTKDKNGQIIGLDLTRMKTVGGEAQTVTTHLPLDNDADRQAVRDYLLSDVGTKTGQTALNLTWDDLAPTDPPGPDANPLQKLLYNKGQTTKQNYSDNATKNGFSGGVKAGPEATLGFDLSATGDVQNLKNAQYLGAPGADGVRRYQDYRECNKASRGAG